MKDVIEMLALSWRERDFLRLVIGFFLFPFTCMIRFRDIMQANRSADKNKPMYSTVWIGNLDVARAGLDQ
jgi:hypothetical protein